MKALRFRVTGRVQGVGFRWSAQTQARTLGLAGWVKNDDDGAVSGWAQGPESALQAFLSWLRAGPPSAHVERVEWSDAEPSALRLFTVRV